MSEQQKQARPGDTVRITIPNAVVTHLDDHDRVVMAKFSDGDRGTYIPETATVEVLERADDPEIGLIREVAPSADGKKKTAIKVGARFSEYPGERSVWVIVETGEVLKDGDVSGIGAVLTALPGTPAAEAEKPRQPVPLSEIFPPRVFRSDGPEPPDDVRAVSDSDHRLPYLIRVGDGWIWSQEKDRPVGAGHSPNPAQWATAASCAQAAALREVV